MLHQLAICTYFEHFQLVLVPWARQNLCMQAIMLHVGCYTFACYDYIIRISATQLAGLWRKPKNTMPCTSTTGDLGWAKMIIYKWLRIYQKDFEKKFLIQKSQLFPQAFLLRKTDRSLRSFRCFSSWQPVGNDQRQQ